MLGIMGGTGPLAVKVHTHKWFELILITCSWRAIHIIVLCAFQIAYGLTETSPVTTQTLMDDPVDLRVSTVGRVHPNSEVSLRLSCLFVRLFGSF